MDVDAVGDWRLEKSGSGLLDSDEYLIRDLDGAEFDMLFYDERVDEKRQDLNLVYEAAAGDHDAILEVLTSHVHASTI